MRLSLNEIKKKFITYTNLIHIALIVLAYVYLASRINQLPPQVPVWYTFPWGSMQLGPPRSLWVIPYTITGLFILNNVLSSWLLRGNQFLSALLNWQGVLVSLLGLIALWRIIILTLP